MHISSSLVFLRIFIDKSKPSPQSWKKKKKEEIVDPRPFSHIFSSLCTYYCTNEYKGEKKEEEEGIDQIRE